jgi:hypothetical protein
MRLRHSISLLIALCSSQLLFAVESAPLLQEGKKSTYQRVLTTPACLLSTDAGAVNGVPQPAFSRFYVYERSKVAGADWVKVGPDSYGKTIGWLPSSCTVDWKMQLTLAFTNSANRDRLLFFKDRDTLASVLDAPDPVSLVAPIRGKLKNGVQAPGILAEEPELFIDIQQQFYLLPVLSGKEIMTEEGFRARILNVASVSKADANTKNASVSSSTSQLKEFSAAVVFVIDSSISMDPYIDRTRDAIRKVYQQIETQNLGKQVKFGMVAFRSSTKAVPGLEYVAQMYVDPNTVKDGADFMSKVADLKQAKVSSKFYDEDSYSGVMYAIDKIDWSQFGARYIVLITDAGAIEGDNDLSGTGLNAEQIKIEATKPGVAIYTLHLKTPSGVKNHSKAEAQYQALSTFPGTNTSLYYPVNAGDINDFGRKMDALSAAIATQVKAAYTGDTAVGSALNATEDPSDKKMLEDAALIGHAMQLAYLGEKTGTQAPPVFQAWIADRDLIKQNVPTTDVRVLLTKGQLSDLSDVMKKILDAANEGLISPTDMFTKLRSVAAAMGADPNQLKTQTDAKMGDMGVFNEFLADLPYHSEVLNLDEQTWASMDGLAQEKFIRNLNTKLRHYQRYNADVDRWVPLAKDADARDNIYPVPLEMMP